VFSLTAPPRSRFASVADAHEGRRTVMSSPTASLVSGWPRMQATRSTIRPQSRSFCWTELGIIRRRQSHALSQGRVLSCLQHLPSGWGRMSRYLVVDCETDGLPRRWDASLADLDNWPRIVQVAWALYDDDQTEMVAAAYLVRPDGFRIPPDAVRIHGITTERATAEGRSLADVLAELAAVSDQADVVVAHNIGFDGRVIAAEFMRLGLVPPFMPDEMVCTMMESAAYCELPGPHGNKWPKLAELHEVLFGSAFDGPHDARNDVAACARCYFELRSRGVIA